MRIVVTVIAIAALTPIVYRLIRAGVLDRLPYGHPLAALVLISVYCIKSVVMVIPFMALFISGGALFPTGWAIVITILGIACELSLGYFAGRFFGGDKAIAAVSRNKTAQTLLSFYGDRDRSICFLARVLPAPFDLMSMFFGATGMPYGRHLLFSLLGVVPNMLPFVIAGHALTNPLSAEFLVPFFISITFSACMFLLLRRMRRQRESE